MSNLFVRSLRGQASLAVAFWIVGVLFSLILSYILLFIFRITMPSFTVADMPIIRAIMFPYTLFSAICIWRCGKNAWIVWNVLAKISVIVAVLVGFYQVLRALHII